MDDAKARNGIEAVQDLLDWQSAEIERLKDVIREQDRLKGTTTARLSMRLGPTMICLTCPTLDERTVASLLFAGVSEWMRCTAMGTLLNVVGREEAEHLLADAWDNPLPSPKKKPEEPIGADPADPRPDLAATPIACSTCERPMRLVQACLRGGSWSCDTCSPPTPPIA